MNITEYLINEYSEDGKVIALVDRTFNNDTKVILIDEAPKKYIQRFWIDGDDKKLVDRCKLMRKLNVESL
jgi:hypothetical protein